jgi:hypothetical protein
MNECESFEVPLRYDGKGDHSKRDGHVSVTHSFTCDGTPDDGVIFAIRDNAMTTAIHTTGASLLELANKIIKELSP